MSTYNETEASNIAVLETAPRGVVRVRDGRGFVVEAGTARYVITAAHALGDLPPPHGASFTEERTYEKLLGQLGEPPSVSCECVFADPVADIAVLGSPENQDLSEEDVEAAYEALVEEAVAFPVAEPPSKPIAQELALNAATDHVRRECPAFLLTLTNVWRPCAVRHCPNDMLWITGFESAIAGGMSGSPIIGEDGSAIGVVCLSAGTGVDNHDKHTEGGPEPRLMGNLPGWLLARLRPQG